MFAERVLSKSPAKKIDLSPLKAADLRTVARMAALTELKLDTWGAGANMAALSALSKLHTLTVDLVKVDSLSGLSSLWLSSSRLEDFTPLSSLPQLKSLALNGCKLLRSLAPLHTMTALEELRIQSCPQLTDLDVIEHLPSLRRVRAYPNNEHPVFSRRPNITVTF